MADAFDVVILGSGPGGYVAAIRAGQLGLKTAMVERDKRLGGTCLLRGCIPTKSLLWTAELLTHINAAAEFGIDLKNPAVNWGQAQKHKEKVVAKGVAGIEFLMKKNKVTVLKGHGRISAKGKVEVAGEGGKQTYDAKNIIIATGSVPKSLPMVPVDHKRVLNSDSILELQKIPASLIVLGAGAVGCEFASIFNHVGSETTIVEEDQLRSRRGRGEGRDDPQRGQGDRQGGQRGQDARGGDGPLGDRTISSHPGDRA